MKDYLRQALESERVINVEHAPAMARIMNSCRGRGEVAAVLPGIYALADRAATFDVRLAAVRASGRGLVVTGRAAAKAVWWPELDCDSVQLAVEGVLLPRYGFQYVQRYIPDQLLVERDGLTLTRPALTVLDLIPELGADAVDEALRRRVVTLGQLQSALALTPSRRGNRLRREILLDSRDSPWSRLERAAHRLLREARIKGWEANHQVIVDGVVYYLDLAWPKRMVAVELDGFAFHGDKDAFHADRRRDARLSAAGWHVLRFSAETMPDMADAVSAALRRSR